MKNIIKYLIIVTLVTFGFSCTDDDLDPLQSKKVKKGTLLALRGTQLDAIYWDGEPYGSAFYANNITGNETFDYDAEFLSEDPNSLESFDIYVIKRTGGDPVRVLLTNISGSSFQITDDYRGPWVAVSLDLADILAAIGADLSTPANIAAFMDLYADGIVLESDLNLKSGEKVLAADLVAGGLYESDQFYPAQGLTYGVEDIDDARPAATTSLSSALPLKSGEKNTLTITFDQSIETAPSVSISPVGAGTIGSVVPVSGTDNKFTVEFTAGGTYTGDATVTISGATSGEGGALAGLVQATKTTAIAVDNLPPQNTSFTTGTRLGKGQSATITLKFNEAIGTAPTVTVDPGTTGIDGVTNVNMSISADGLTVTYVYEYKDLDNNATHGDATVSIAGGKDKAGHSVPAIDSKPLTIDIGAAPAPSIALDGSQYDWGNQIKWTLSYATGGSNPGGSTTGTAYYVAVTSGAAAPTGFVGGDVPAFTMASGVTARQIGTIAITSGTSGSVFSAFAPNGLLDVYVVFVSSTGVISAISAPTTVTME